MNFLTKKIICF